MGEEKSQVVSKGMIPLEKNEGKKRKKVIRKEKDSAKNFVGRENL